MAVRLYIADPQDANWPIAPTTAAIELNGFQNGDPNGFGLVGDLDMGENAEEQVLIAQSPYPGSIQASRRHDVVEVRANLMIPQQADYPSIRARVVDLGEALDTHGVLVLEYEAGKPPIFYDYLPSPVAAIFRGIEMGTQRILSQLFDPDGYPLSIIRQPYGRTIPQQGSNLTVNTQPRNRHYSLRNNGNVPALAYVKIRPDSSAAMVQARIAMKSRGNLTEFAQIYGKELENASSFNQAPENTTGGTTAVGDTAASNGSTLDTVMNGTGKTHEQYRRWYDIIDPSDPRSIEGRYRLFVGVKLKNASVVVQLKYGFTADLTQPAEIANDEKDLNVASGGFTAVYTEVDMGYVTVPIGTSVLRLEGWAGDPQDTSNGILWDYYRLEPADEQVTIVSTPGFRSGGAATRKWLARDMTKFNEAAVDTGSKQDGDVFITDAATERVYSKPATGIQLPTGRYAITAHGSVKDPNDVTENVGEFRIEYTTDASGATGWATLKDAANNNIAKSLVGRGHSKYTAFDTTLTFSADPVNRYRYVVEQQLTTGSGREIHLREYDQEFLKTVRGSDAMVIDGFRQPGEQAIRSNADDRLWNLSMQGGFVTIPPGDALAIVSCYELPPTNYDQVDITEPLAAVDRNRSYVVRIDSIERRMGA